MSKFVGDLRVPTTLFEAAAWRYTLKAQCTRCSNFAIFEAAGLWWHFLRQRGDVHIRDAHRALYCFACSTRAKRRIRSQPLLLMKERPTRMLPLPDEREWKRAVSRFRA